MKFRTEYIAERSSLTLDPSRPIVLVGSCFAANIASKMRECKWEAFNGVGTLYNPMSISRVLELLVLADNPIDSLESSLFEAEERIHSWLFDSHFSASSKEKCLEGIFKNRDALLKALEGSQALIVTFGTAWCYALNHEYLPTPEAKEDYIVANCHKMPSAMFSRRRVSVEEISRVWISMSNQLRLKYPDLKIIFTVSPVRHLKDGFEGNTLSKATLHLAVEDICRNVDNCLYFPAYELVCDDLRDYRFYASDLVHPSDSAVEYIWENFCKTYLDEKGMLMLKAGLKEYKRLNHRPIQKN